MQIGIDEAGRGPVIGPMVIAFALDTNQNISYQKDIKDSKALSPKKRNEIIQHLKNNLDYIITIIYPTTIDKYVFYGKLNYLESDVINLIFKEFISKYYKNHKIEIYIDSPEPPHTFKNKLSLIPNSKTIIENKADSKYKIVGAASIFAKVTRDAIITHIKNTIDVDFGSGYPSDPKTKKFVSTIIKNNFKQIQNLYKQRKKQEFSKISPNELDVFYNSLDFLKQTNKLNLNLKNLNFLRFSWSTIQKEINSKFLF